MINTHHHADHSGGNAKLQLMNVQVIVSEQARENMAAVPLDDPQWSVPNVAFQNHLSIQLGGKRLELYRFGQAHTNGDVVVYFPAARTLAAGDVFCVRPQNTPIY